jgi:hypothetical protein
VRRRGLLVALSAALLAGLSPRAHAKKIETLPYPFADVWPAALRFLRIDEGYTIAERDDQAGYIVFKFVPAGTKREAEGSFEIVRHGAATELIAALPSMPAHHERALVERFVAKLTREFGKPKEPAHDPAAKRKTAPNADAGTD